MNVSHGRNLIIFLKKTKPKNGTKANSYKVVLLAQLSAFMSTRDCQMFCIPTVSKKNFTPLISNTFLNKEFL